MAKAREIDRLEIGGSEVGRQVTRESERRERLAVPAIAGGVLYLLSVIVLASALNGIPTVGVLQGIAPALRGEPDPAVAPGAAEIVFQSHRAFGLIAGSVLSAVAFVSVVLVLLLLLEATRFRRPQTNRAARPLVLAGGLGVAVLGVLTQVVLAIRRHNFATAHNFTSHAVNAVIHNTAFDVLAYVTPLAGISLAAGMIIAMMGSVRVGLLPRWVGIVGGVSAVLLLLPPSMLQVVPAFWLVAVGVLLMGRWSSGDPPAWASGEARPWPSQAELRAGQSAGAKSDVAPEPVQPAAGSTARRRRKRSSRR